MVAVVKLLKESSLTFLCIDGWVSCSRQTALSLLENLSNSQNIRELRISPLLEVEFSEIMQVVLEKDTLQSFHLNEQMRIDDSDLRAIVQLKRRRNPLTLKLNDKTYQQYPNTMEAILTAHPGIRIQKPFRIDCWPMKQVAFLRDFNWHGRYLVERMDMPLSLWPQVLQIAGMRTF